MLHLEITMAVPCYILKASSPSFPLHTKCSGKRKKKNNKKRLGATWERKASVEDASCLLQPLVALCKNNRLENKAPAGAGGGVENASQIKEDGKQESYLPWQAAVAAPLPRDSNLGEKELLLWEAFPTEEQGVFAPF